MSFNAGELEAYIGLNDDKFNRTLDRDRDELGRFVGKKHQAALDIDTTQAQSKLGTLAGLVSDHSEQIKSAGMKMTAGITLPYAIGTALAIENASSLNEAQNKVNVVFDESAGSVLRWGQNAADAIGQSERQALSAAGTFGNLFVSMDMGARQSADMSMSLTELASDLASFNDTSPDEALEALRSGLVGETEPMRRFGVMMDEAALKAQALAMGLSWQGETLPPLIKAQSAYALIMEQTAPAQGDYARTADEVANAQRGITASAEDMSAAWGDELLPVMKDALAVAKPVLGLFEDLPDPVKKASIALGGLFAIVGPSLWVLGGAVDGLKSLSSVWSKVRTAFTVADSVAIGENTAAVEANTIARTLNARTPPVGSSGAVGAIGTGASGLGTSGAAASGAGSALSTVGAAFAIGTASITTGTLVIEAADAFKQWWESEGQAKESAVGRAETLGAAIGRWQSEHPGAALPESLQKALEAWRKDVRGLDVDITKGPLGLYFSAQKNQEAIAAYNKAVDVYSSGNADAIAAYREATIETSQAADSTDANTTAVDALTGAVVDNTDAQKNLAQSMLDDAREAASKGAGVMSNKEFVKYVSTLPTLSNADNQPLPWPRKAARGADFVTSGPELLLVGDNASGKERVTVTPSEDGGGRASFSLTVKIGQVVGTDARAAQNLADMVGDVLVPRVLDALAVT